MQVLRSFLKKKFSTHLGNKLSTASLNKLLIFSFVFLTIPKFYSQSLYFTDGRLGEIYHYDIENDISTKITEGLSDPYSLAYDSYSKNLFWTDRDLKKIGTLDCSTFGLKYIVESGLDEPRGIIVDSINHLIYWVDVGNSTIKRSQLDGSDIEIVSPSFVREPHDITLDLINNHFYWTDRRAKTINRCDLDGANCEVVITSSSGLPWPSGLDISHELNKIYWTDTQTESLHRSNMDGSNIENLNASSFSTPFRVKVDDENKQLYISDWNRTALVQTNMEGQEVNFLENSSSGFRGIIGLDLGQDLDLLNRISRSNLSYDGCKGDNYQVVSNGVTYNESNPSGTETIVTNSGCDSIITINLTFDDLIEDNMIFDICDDDNFAISFNSSVYDINNESGVELFTSTTGCDTLKNIQLNFYNSSQNNIDYKGCKGDNYQVVSNGVTYNETNPSGIEILKNNSGCDSIITINLTFDELIEESLIYDLCDEDNFEITINSRLYNINNKSGSEIFPSTSACDTIRYIELNFHQTSSDTIKEIRCFDENYSLEVNNSEYNHQNPQGIETMTSVHNCDSIVVVDLKFIDCHEECRFYIPNIISKQSTIDKEFKVYDLENCQIDYFELSIYSRWGELIYYSQEPDISLDASILNSAVYAYKITLHTSFNKETIIGDFIVLE